MHEMPEVKPDWETWNGPRHRTCRGGTLPAQKQVVVETSPSVQAKDGSAGILNGTQYENHDLFVDRQLHHPIAMPTLRMQPPYIPTSTGSSAPPNRPHPLSSPPTVGPSSGSNCLVSSGTASNPPMTILPNHPSQTIRPETKFTNPAPTCVST